MKAAEAEQDEASEIVDWHDDDYLSFSGGVDAENYVEETDNNLRDLGRHSMKQRTVQLPPWMTQPHLQTGLHRINPMVALHNEIVSFCTLIEPKEREIQIRSNLVDEVSDIIKSTFTTNEECAVHVFGSQATGLFLPTSDIDLVVMLKERPKEDVASNDEEGDWHVTNRSPLHRVADVLKMNWRDKLAYLEVIENTRVPLVKCTHKPSGVSIDICFNQDTGVKAATLMTTFLKAMPPLRPLAFVLKYFTASRGLNEPYSGGVGSYLLQLLIVSFLQHRERDAIKFHRPSPYNLGCLLVELCELYGMDLNFVTTGISVRHDGYYFPKGAMDRREHFFQQSRPFAIAVENPLEPSMDVGKASFRIHLVQRTLEAAFKVLRSHVTDPRVPCDSILGSILPVTQEMWERHRQLVAEGNEDMWESSSSSSAKNQEVKQETTTYMRSKNQDMWGDDESSEGEMLSPVNKKARTS